MRFTRTIFTIVALAMMTMIVGCGFHLRGSTGWPAQYKTIYLSSFDQKTNRFSFMGNFQRQLPDGITVVSSPQDADLHVSLLSESINIRALSSSTYGQNKEETYYYSASVQVTDRNGNILIPVTTLSRQKDFSYNEGDLLGKSIEVQELKKDLVSEAAIILIRRLNAAMKKI